MLSDRKKITVLLFLTVIIYDILILLQKIYDNPGLINHLTFALSTDPVNGSLWKDLKNLYSVGSTIHPVIGLAPEIIINNIFGYKYIWAPIIFFKGICAAIFYYSLISISSYKLEKKYQIIYAILVFILFTSLSIIYGDRLSRPHLNPTLVLVSFCIIFNYSKNNILIFIVGIIQCIPISHDPWLAPYSCLFIILLLWILEKKISNILIFLTGLGIAVIISYFRMIYISPIDINYLEYLGKKDIYDRGIFYYDYLMVLLKSPYIFLPSAWIIIISLASKQSKIAMIYVLTLILAVIPSTILGFVVQSYHYKIAASTFAIIISIIISVRSPVFCFDIKKIRIKFNVFLVFCLLIFNAIPFTSEGTLFKNRLFERAVMLDKQYGQLVEKLSSYSHQSSNCILVSNDFFLRPYALIKDFSVFPKEGVLLTRQLVENVENDEIMDVAYSLALRKKYLNETIEVYSDLEFAKDLFRIRVHDKYSSSRSWMANSVIMNSEYTAEEIHNINKISSFQAWPFFVPINIINRAIEVSINLDVTDFNKIILVVKKPDGTIGFYSNCK